MSSIDSSTNSLLYLGLDCSTQSCKLTLIDQHECIRAQAAVNYDADLPEFHTNNGVIRGSHGLDATEEAKSKQKRGNSGEVITTPALLFVSALELGLKRLQAVAGVQLSQIARISVSGQQHGSVYWKQGSSRILSTITASGPPLVEQLRSCFSVPNCPIWMDSSTTMECQQLEAHVGSGEKVASITGSRAFERFTGNQISKILHDFPAAYADTERIGLISSFIPSLLQGRYVPIDASDGAGMNLMSLDSSKNNSFDWSEVCLQACVEGSDTSHVGDTNELRRKLGPIVSPSTVIGPIHAYYVQKYGFNPSCAIVAGSGDNPCSLVGLGLTQSGDIGVSLGTSDTMFGIIQTQDSHPGIIGHTFPNPSSPFDTRMLMLCIKNGSLAREAVRDSLNSGNKKWEEFNEKISKAPIGTSGKFYFALPECEIVPSTRRGGYFVVDSTSSNGEAEPVVLQNANAASDPNWCRGVIESQFLSLRVHARELGLSTPKKIVVTGGAAVNAAIIQILADVFGCEVEAPRLIDQNTNQDIGQLSDTASLGAALRALRATDVSGSNKFVPSTSSGGSSITTTTATTSYHARSLPLVKGREEQHKAYTQLLDAFTNAQQRCVNVLNRA